jgi:PAS domain S-box-containing protein
MFNEVLSDLSFDTILLRMLSSNSTDFFVVIYKGTRQIVWANDRALQMFEYDDEEVFRQRYFNTLRKVKPTKEYLQTISDSINSKGFWEEETELMTKTGRVFRGKITMRSFTYNHKELLLVRIVDIEKLKTSEAALRELNSELENRVREKTQSLENTIAELQKQCKITQQAKEDLARVSLFQRAVWDNAGALIVVTDANGVIQHFNKVAEKKLGYLAKEVEGKLTPAIFHDVEETIERTKALSEELGEEIKPGFDTFTAKARRNIPNDDEWIHIRKDGKRFPVKLSVTAIRNEEAEITGYIGVSLDISDEVKLSNELLKNLDRERELNKMKSIFITTASHEFRTPLAGIKSSAALLEKYTKTEEQDKRTLHLNRIRQSVNNLTSILEEFLSLGKIEEGKTGAKYEVFNLKELLERICVELKSIAKPGQILSCRYEGSEKINSDPVFLRHILTNLSENAIKYSPEGASIHSKIQLFEKELSITVSDNGIGIPKADQKYLFDRFFRASNVAGTQGTGLGLYITKRYVELLKGVIRIKSEEGAGTEITIILPLNGKN